ncbi:MAG: VOC family protein [Polyangiales bacterium]
MGLVPIAYETAMFSHVFLGVRDFDRALAFYRSFLPVLGIAERFCDRSRPWAGWQSSPGPRPLFLIGTPYDGSPHEVGNGQMVAFLAPSREAVDRAYEVALANGGADEGAPGLRPHYHAHYYGAYFRDPEGNKLCVVCHDAPADEFRDPR